MSDQFEWQETTTEFREERHAELRWIINREVIINTRTGKTVTRAVMRHPGICVILPCLDDGRFLLMRQYRYSIDAELWEAPAGTLNGRETQGRMAATETPEECAARELREETGYTAGRLERVLACYAMPGSSDEIIHLFFARDLQEGEPELDEGEEIRETRFFTGEELEGMIGRGEIRDAKTLIALFAALSRRPAGVRIA